MPVAAAIRAAIIANHSKTFDLSAPTGTVQLATELALANGTADNQADRVWGDTRSIAAAEDLDLAGVLVDQFGDTITFAEIVAILVFADALNTGNIIVGGAPANAWVGPFGAATHTLAIKPGGLKMFYDPAGWPVTGGTVDLLRVAPSTGTQAYSIVILGRSA